MARRQIGTAARVPSGLFLAAHCLVVCGVTGALWVAALEQSGRLAILFAKAQLYVTRVPST